MLRLINYGIDLCVLWDAYHELFCVFGDFYASGMQDPEITKSQISATEITKQNIINFYK